MKDDSSRMHVEYDGAVPRLPRRVPTPAAWKLKIKRLLQPGSHSLWFEPRVTWRGVQATRINGFLGPLRVEYSWGAARASADLYLVRVSDFDGSVIPTGFPEKQLSEVSAEHKLECLQFPLARYRYYLALYRMDKVRNALRLQFLAYRLQPEGTWTHPQRIYFDLGQAPGDALVLRNGLGTPIGEVRINYLSPFFRVAGVEVEALDNCEKPTDQRLWNKLNKVKWQVRVQDLKKPAGALPPRKGRGWELRDLRRYLRTRQWQSVVAEKPEGWPLIAPWRYSLQIVSFLLNGGETVGGFMYAVRDRRGAALSAKIPAVRDQPWPLVEESPRAFHRVALHEFGHMQGLYHGHDGSLMQSGRPRWRWQLRYVRLKHSWLDAIRLKHLPDAWVRPEGLPFGHRYRTTALDIQDLVTESPPSVFELGVAEINGQQAVSDPNGNSVFQLRVGESLTEVRLSLSKLTAGVVGRPPRRVSPPRGAASVSLELPSGILREVATALLPPVSARPATAGSSRHKITLGKSVAVIRQAGIFRLTVELLWEADGEYHRVKTTVPISTK